MSQIQIFFGGICIFFEQYVPDVHRMVLVNADISELVLGSRQHSVIPHNALLTLSTPFNSVLGPMLMPPNLPGTEDYDLNVGFPYTITVANPIESQGWSNNAGCLPHLQAALPPGVQLGPPSNAVLNGGDAACYVDFTYGTIDGLSLQATHGPMGIAVATVQTNGNPQLLIQSHNPPFEQVLLEFTSADPVISITNKPFNPEADDENDFLLNFLVCADPPPPDVVVPLFNCPPPNRPVPAKIQHMDAGPGCSNTNFP